MSDFINELRDARLRAWEAAKAVNEATITEGRSDPSFSAEEQVSWDKANADVDALDVRIAALVDAEKREAAIADALGSAARVPAAVNAEAVGVTDQFRSLAAGEVRSIELAPSAGFTVERRDLTKGTPTAGGNVVPTSFYDQLIAHLIEVSGIMMAGPTVLNTTSGENFEVPVTTAHSTGALVAEATGITESDPAFAKRTLGAYKYGVIVQVSRELLEDSGVDLTGYLAMEAGRAIGNAFGVDLAVGNGSSKPSGIVQTATAGVTGDASLAGAPTADKLIDLFYSVISPYRNSPSCAWLMRDSTMATVRKLKGSDNNYLWQPGLQLGAPDSLLGKPVFTDPNIAAVALSAKSVVFGDISRYMVRLAGGIRFDRSDDFAFNADLVTFKATLRGDGILADQTGAVKLFTGNAA